ncbi:SulP family inorganic anion transporter [Aureispira anguillae]|uniref:SulP family inorganic anion transporter n=1 Tax=Aureispira anguillae TaxID=2864201 RepID=A0A915YL37_9BACT|nr:SulP family inorganic anion transporter [Aureispira anguillae]BDS15212.1 SulP family inorganic anion transporter [Aureispira anguillae]
MKHTAPNTGLKGALENWRNDLIAALSVALVALPLSLGVALASGMQPMAGLLTAIIGGVVATIFRGGHVAINGPAAGLIAAVFVAIGSLNDIDPATGQIIAGSGIRYTLAAIVVSGGIQVLMGIFKLGKLAEIFPSSVIHGILAAIGVIIFAKQIHPALGTSSEATDIIGTLLDAFYLLPSLNPFVAIISLTGLLLLIFHPKLSYKFFHFLPAPMWVLLIAIPFVYWFNFFEDHSIEFLGRSYEVGSHLLIDLSNGLPDDPNRSTLETFMGCIMHPDFSKINSYPFWLAVISITLIGSITTLVCAKAIDKLDPYQRKTDLNKDLVAVGLSSIVSGALGGLPVIAVIVRSTVNIQNNAKTRFSNLYHGLFLLLFVLLLTPVLEQVPLSALAIILVFTGFKLASPRIFKKAYEKGMEQLIFVVATLIITLQTDQLWGIIGGITITLTVQLLLARVSIQDFFRMIFKSHSQLLPIENNQYTLQLNGIVNFLSLLNINKLLEQVPPECHLIIDGSRARLVDLTVLETFHDFKFNFENKNGSVQIIGLENHVTSSDHTLALKSNHTSIEKPLGEREKRLEAKSAEKGWLFSHSTDWNSSYFNQFQFFDSRPIERKSNRIEGTYSELGVEWQIADIEFDEGALMSSEVYNTTVQFLKLPFKIPRFVIEQEGFWDKMFDRIKAFTGYKDIDFELFPEFSKKFLLEGIDEKAIRAFFTPDLILFLEKHEIYHIESNGEALLIFKYRRLAKTNEMTKMVDFSEKLIKKITPNEVQLNAAYKLQNN